ncbi:FUSC family protein [Chitinibacter fontanus]|uniref:FUSC family protein n=1 Tax=Chitinibacter fontanus TaxID=1737446 RepID=A0A7D5V953_9NEIS|nr:aromatic acid exporter family protein [Chitinibacter fontanus]QLI81176.1 FUSC family protein [Chitinibacter fontanus]
MQLKSISRDNVILLFRVMLATGLSLLLVMPLSFQPLYYAPLGALLVANTELDASFRVGLHRLYGTLIGALLALIVVNVALPLPLSVSLGLGVGAILCRLLGWSSGTGVMGAVLLIMGTETERQGFVYPEMRLFTTLIGVAVGLLINALFSWLFARRRLLHQYICKAEALLEHLQASQQQVQTPESLHKLYQQLQAFEAVSPLLRLEKHLARLPADWQCRVELLDYVAKETVYACAANLDIERSCQDFGAILAELKVLSRHRVES